MAPSDMLEENKVIEDTPERSLMMTSVAYVEERIQYVMNEGARKRARETGCVQRQRKFDGASLLQTLVFGFLSHPHGSLESLASMATVCDVLVSDTAINKRFSKECAEFLLGTLEELSSVIVNAEEPVPSRLLQRFSSVELQDSSVVTLPDEFKELWRGIGNPQGKAQATIKAHGRWDLLSGGLKGPLLTSGRTSDKDNAWLNEAIEAKSLEITDLGYLDLKRIARRRQAHAYSLTRYRADVVVCNEEGKRIAIEQVVPPKVGQGKEMWVRVGAQQRIPMRLLMVRVPKEVAEVRQQRIKRAAQIQQREINPLTWELAHWTIFLTDAPADKISLEEGLVLLGGRWQIELLWKVWKQEGQVDEWWTNQAWRSLCELYAKMIGMLLQHWMIVLFAWHNSQRSLVKLAGVVRDCAMSLMEALAGKRALSEVFDLIRRRMQAGCSMNKRHTKPNSGQLFDGASTGWLST